MADHKARRIALLPIKPRFVDAIACGAKKVEFRKTPFPLGLTHVIMYATKPVQQIVGFFEVREVVTDKLGRLWEKYQPVSGLGKREFQAYYLDRDEGVALVIGRVTLLDEPLPLAAVLANAVPPQGLRYLEPDALLAVRGELAAHWRQLAFSPPA